MSLIYLCMSISWKRIVQLIYDISKHAKYIYSDEATKKKGTVSATESPNQIMNLIFGLVSLKNLAYLVRFVNSV